MSMLADYVITSNGLPNILKQTTSMNNHKNRSKKHVVAATPTVNGVSSPALIKTLKNQQNFEINNSITRRHHQYRHAMDRISSNKYEICDKINKCLYNDSLKKNINHRTVINNCDNRFIYR
jgi:hypothetical protein